MACLARLEWGPRLVLGLALALAACGDEAASDAAESESTTGAESGGTEAAANTSAPTTTSTSSSSTSTTTDGAPGGDDASTTSTTLGGSTSGVEDTLFGMSDDMPLVADIPDIKRGLVEDGTLVILEQVRPTTTRATLGGEAWFYVQDPYAVEHMGLRVALQPGEQPPPAGFEAFLEGIVQYDGQGWRLVLDTALTGGVDPVPPARQVRVATLTGPDAEVFDDSVVDVVEPSALVVTRRGPQPGTLLVGAVTGSSGALLVDLRPFDLDAAPPSPGTHLSRLRGVVEIGGPRPVILPRSSYDFIVDP